MKRLLISISISMMLTISCWTIGHFITGIDLLLLPLMFLLLIIGFSGLITIPIGLIRIIKKQSISKKLILPIGLAVGFFLGMIIQKPIDSWDKNQRNLSGEIVTTELENYKINYGSYPDSLNQLDFVKVNEQLPNNYKIERFTYYIRDNEYDLDIPIPIFDRWHWNKDKNEFEYSDF